MQNKKDENLEKEEIQDGLQIDFEPSQLKALYSNMCFVAHSSQSEFVLDFLSFLPGMKNPMLEQRVVMSPQNMLRLLHTIADNINKYEQQYGEIKLENESPEEEMDFDINTNKNIS